MPAFVIAGTDLYSRRMPATAIIPLKALGQAKGRLADVLDAGGRRDVVTWMAQLVIAACQECDLIDDILVVAGDAEAAAVAGAAGVRSLVVSQPGLGAALARADAKVSTAEATIVVAADLPEVTSADLRAVLESLPSSGPAVVIAPTLDGGTGALVRRPPGVIGTAYGPNSATAHQQLAQAAGIHAAIVDRPGLARDVDTPDQLRHALALAETSDVGCPPR